MKLLIIAPILLLLSSCDPFTEILLEAQTLGGSAGNAPQHDCQNCLEENPECPSRLFKDKNVVYIGDSHSYLTKRNGARMGNEIINTLNNCEAKSVTYAAACGSRPRNWSKNKTPKSTCGISSYSSHGPFNTQARGSLENLETLIQKNKGEVTVINLGDNMFNWKRKGGKSHAKAPSGKSIKSEVQALLRSIPASGDCVWVGPAYHSPGRSYVKSNHAVDSFYQHLIPALNGNCRLIDSRPYFQSTRANDGLHFTSSESGIWGKRISDELKTLK